MSTVIRRLPLVLALLGAMTLSMGCASLEGRLFSQFNDVEEPPIDVVISKRDDPEEDKRWLMRLLFATE